MRLDFAVLALPRSGTTWLANLLTTDTTLCRHDPFATAMPAEPIHSSGLRPILSISSTVIRQAPMLSAPDSTLISSESLSEKPTACHSTAP